jgi:hypothetical protein
MMNCDRPTGGQPTNWRSQPDCARLVEFVADQLANLEQPLFALANKGHDTRSLLAYLGHKNIQHTVRYTELSPDRFKDFWR